MLADLMTGQVRVPPGDTKEEAPVLQQAMTKND